MNPQHSVANLTVSISLLRRILGEKDGNVRYIETVPKRGYRFIAPVREGLCPHAVAPETDSSAMLRLRQSQPILDRPGGRSRAARGRAGRTKFPWFSSRGFRCRAVLNAYPQHCCPFCNDISHSCCHLRLHRASQAGLSIRGQATAQPYCPSPLQSQPKPAR